MQALDNRDVVNIIDSLTSLMELNDYDPRKVSSYNNAIFNLERLPKKLRDMSEEEIKAINGVGPSIAKAIREILDTGTLALLEELKETTSKGLQELLTIRGIGAGKIKMAWRELDIDSIDKMLASIHSGELQKLKGFGEKTVTNLEESLTYYLSNKGKLLLPAAMELASSVEQTLKDLIPNVPISIVGDILLKRAIIDKISFLIAADKKSVEQKLNEIPGLDLLDPQSGPFAIRGRIHEVPAEFLFCQSDEFEYKKFMLTGSENHFSALAQKGTRIHELESKNFDQEKFYKTLNLPLIAWELREGVNEFAVTESDLVTEESLKGILHCHSTYSDGRNTLREMAEGCRSLGYQYLGIADHSKSAFYYANGMYENRVVDQHEEIDQLNKELAPFRIFKGIESDILPDGDLDYELEFLDSFDFVVASVHSVLNMDIEKATSRLLTAIENPYTTILGHLTGRVLLQRQGFPVDHKQIIDHCAKHEVVIEINAHPARLDMDWTWVQYALEKGVMLSINPDAHSIKGYEDMKYGVWSGRKGGLPASSTLNAMTADEIARFFASRKNSKSLVSR